jgi:hypothetical protein
MAASAIAQEEEGWTDLFNGTDLEGWEQKGGEAKYTVEDGQIIGTSVPDSPNSFLCTKKEYADFILEFEFKGHADLNSGVQIRSNSLESYKKGRVHGYQVELEEEVIRRDWSGGIYDEGRRGWLDPHPDDEDAQIKFGKQGRRIWMMSTWNKVRVEVQGDHIQTWINGFERADLHDDETSEGFIALQVHSTKEKEPMSVRWRNIRIKEIE